MKVGILGAGQLAQMLALAAPPLGLRVKLLAQSPEDPAAHLGETEFADLSAEAALKNPVKFRRTIRSFAKGLDLLSFESEFIDSKLVKEATQGLPVRVFPSPEILGRLQDRKSQKEFLQEYHLPTSEWRLVSDSQSLQEAGEFFNYNFVLKLRTHGYDGRGTYYCRSKQELAQFDPIIKKFPKGFIAEKFQRFSRELAVMIARSADGSVFSYPLVESKQKNSQCELVLGPIHHRKFPSLKVKIQKALSKVNYVGIIAFELFEVAGELIINEVAPRVHNSGHYSQLAYQSSQFRHHWLCGLGEKLSPNSAFAPAFGMLNLIGQSESPALLNYQTASTLHWYNKSINKPGRKMGHLNALGKNLSQVAAQLKKDRRKISL